VYPWRPSAPYLSANPGALASVNFGGCSGESGARQRVVTVTKHQSRVFVKNRVSQLTRVDRAAATGGSSSWLSFPYHKGIAALLEKSLPAWLQQHKDWPFAGPAHCRGKAQFPCCC